MKNLKIQSYLYDKSYNDDFDIVEYSLTIKNFSWDVVVKITSNISIEDLKTGITDLVIYSNNIIQYTLSYNSLTQAFFEAEQFLEHNNLLLYIPGYGTQDYFIDKISSTPKSNYNYEPISDNYYQER